MNLEIYVFQQKLQGVSIASTGFSFLLEAYMNFSVFGVALVCFIVGFAFSKVRKSKKQKYNSVLIRHFI